MNFPKSVPDLRGMIPRLASMRIAVVCIFLLLVLTAWGTIYQADQGLYAAQVRFFYSWFFLIGGVVPFPGAQLVLWVLFVNMVASMLFRVTYSFANLGNIVTHAGLLFLLAGSFVTYRYATESYLPLQEREVSNVSLDRRQWELAVWAEPAGGLEKQITALEIGPRQTGEEIAFDEFGFKVVLQNYYRNCDAVSDLADHAGHDHAPGEGHAHPAGAHPPAPGTGKLVPRRPAADPEDNIAGAVLRTLPREGAAREVSLFGAEEQPITLTAGGKTLNIALRKKRHPLPITLKLLDVKKEEYPGTGIARNYQSDVEIQGDGMKRNSRIYMNNPLRYQNFTFFQSSYFVDQRGRETSVFAVVENRGRLIPYIASGMIFGGMAVHFVLMLLGIRPRPTGEAA